MSPRQHLSLLAQAVGAWTAFWIVGLPRYYQQYPAELMGVLSVLLSVAISLWAVFVLLPVPAARRVAVAKGYALYFSLPLAVLDTLYCGMYLGRGHQYLVEYWYLTVFYASLWLTMLPTAWLLNRAGIRGSEA